MWQRLPMGRGRVLVPTDLRRLPDGLWLHAACRPVARTVWNTVGRMSRVSLAPLRHGLEPWEPPVAAATWAEWIDMASACVGREIHRWIVAPAPDAHRARFSLILLDADLRQVGYAKFTRNPPAESALRAEAEFTQTPPLTFATPRLLGQGRIDAWTYSINAPLPAGPHLPASLSRDHRRAIVSEIQARLSGLVGDGETPIHGDFTPWNVRSIRDKVVVVDWEQFGPGPVPADELWHVVTSELARGRSTGRAIARCRRELTHYSTADLREAATFWRRRESNQEPPEVDIEAARSPKLLRLAERISSTLQAIEAR